MRQLGLLWFGACLIFCVPTHALEMKEASLGVENIYVPSGFDSNDLAEVVVAGWLPSPCYQQPKSAVRRENGTVFVTVTATKLDMSGKMCAQMIVPFILPVQLGVLPEGKQQIVVNKKETEISVQQSQVDNVDDYIYAHVEKVKVSKDGKMATLEGVNPSNCIELDNIRVFSNGKDTYSILPIMKQVKQDCPMKKMPFVYKVRIPEELTANKILLHVRSLDGRSVNQEIERTE